MKKRLGSYINSNSSFIEVTKIEKGVVIYRYLNSKKLSDSEYTATLHPEGLYFYDKEYLRKHFLREFH